MLSSTGTGNYTGLGSISPVRAPIVSIEIRLLWMVYLFQPTPFERGVLSGDLEFERINEMKNNILFSVFQPFCLSSQLIDAYCTQVSPFAGWSTQASLKFSLCHSLRFGSLVVKCDCFQLEIPLYQLLEESSDACGCLCRWLTVIAKQKHGKNNHRPKQKIRFRRVFQVLRLLLFDPGE